MSHSELIERSADSILRRWGHNPAGVRRLAALPSGLHWERLLRRARYWSNTVDVFEVALEHLLDAQAGRPARADQLDEIILRVIDRIDVLQRTGQGIKEP